MSAFEALFAFYGLLLGLAIAAVASGFGEQLRRRRVRPVGWLVPLLGVYVLLTATHQWLSFWDARDELTMRPAHLFMALAMALPYIFVAQVMFPASDDDIADGDAHYLADRRIFLGVLMLPPAFSLAFNLAVNPAIFTDDIPGDLLAWIFPLVVLAALIPIRRRAWQLAGLLLLIANRLWVIVF
jgi:hypothetical protein